MLRSKFRVDRVIVHAEARQLQMSPVIGKENEDWSQWTPSGQFSIYVTNPAAFPMIDAMREGDHHYLDLSDTI